MNKTGLYVYAIVSADDIFERQFTTGIDDEPLHIVRAAGLGAVVHTSATEPYQGPDAEVERWILEHSQVVDTVWEAAGTVLPVTFNVIVRQGDDGASAEDRLQEWLAASADTVREHLEDLRDRVELRVEISLDEAVVASTSQDLIEMQRATESRPAGVQRLYRKRLEERTREVAEKAADRLYPEYRRRLVSLAEDLSENTRPGRNPGSVSVLTVSLLVNRADMDAIGLELADIRDHQPGAQIRYLGPWPPYSFADVPELDGT